MRKITARKKKKNNNNIPTHETPSLARRATALFLTTVILLPLIFTTSVYDSTSNATTTSVVDSTRSRDILNDYWFSCGQTNWGVKNYKNYYYYLPAVFGRAESCDDGSNGYLPYDSMAHDARTNYIRLNVRSFYIGQGFSPISWQAGIQGTDPWAQMDTYPSKPNPTASKTHNDISSKNLYANASYALSSQFIWLNDARSSPRFSSSTEVHLLGNLWFCDEKTQLKGYADRYSDCLVMDLLFAKLVPAGSWPNRVWSYAPADGRSGSLKVGGNYSLLFASPNDGDGNGKDDGYLYHYSVVLANEGKDPGTWWELKDVDVSNYIQKAFSTEYVVLGSNNSNPRSPSNVNDYKLVDAEVGAEIFTQNPSIFEIAQVTAGYSKFQLQVTR